MSINVNQLAIELASALTEYTQEVGDGVKNAVDKVTTEGLKNIRADSPELSGSYKKGWSKTTPYESKISKRNTIYNKTDYQLTHLLEHGHASRYGGRVNAKVHIKPNEDMMISELEKEVERAVRDI